MPRWYGSTPNLRAMGTISGTTTTIAEKMSISMPTPMRKKFKAIRNMTLEVMNPSIDSRITIGTRA